MKHRKLRIAWSVAWGIIAVLFIALWIRSYWWLDVSSIFPGTTFASANGELSLVDEMEWASNDGEGNPRLDALINGSSNRLEFVHDIKESYYVRAPHFAIALIAGTAASATWLPWRFSLRTLLFATTLVAVGLGLIVWLR